MVRTVRMRGPRKECIACEEGPTIIDYLGQYGYEDFCSGPAEVDGDGANVERIGVKVRPALIGDLPTKADECAGFRRAL